MKYRVTVTRTGFVYVDAKNKEAAENMQRKPHGIVTYGGMTVGMQRIVRKMKTMIALMTKIISLSKIMLL